MDEPYSTINKSLCCLKFSSSEIDESISALSLNECKICSGWKSLHRVNARRVWKSGATSEAVAATCEFMIYLPWPKDSEGCGVRTQGTDWRGAARTVHTVGDINYDGAACQWRAVIANGEEPSLTQRSSPPPPSLYACLPRPDSLQSPSPNTQHITNPILSG